MATAIMPTYDYETEADALKRRQQIADAMQMSSLRPMELPTQPGVKASWTQALAKLMEGYVAGKVSDKIKTDRSVLSDRYRTDTKTGFEAYDLTSRGDGTSENVGDPRKAIFDAMASNNPILQQFAMAQLTEQGKGAITPKDLLPLATPESVLRDPTNTRGFVPKRKLEQATPGNVLYDEAGTVANLNQPAGTASPGMPGLPSGPGWGTRDLKGDLYQESGTGLKKLDNAAKVNVTNSPLIQGTKAGVEAWSKAAAETVTDMATSARSSVQLLSRLGQMAALTAGGTNAGPLADAATFLQGLAAQAGIKVDAAQLANSQAFNSVSTQAWAALMQQNGGARGLVKEESAKLAESLPALMQTPQGRAQITKVLAQAAQQNIADAKAASSQYSKALQSGNLSDFTFGLSNTQLPQSLPTSPASGSVSGSRKPTVTDW